MAAAYTRPLQRKLQEAGLQGVVEADAFQVLLKYVADTEGDLDSLYKLLESLKQDADTTTSVTKADVEAAIQQQQPDGAEIKDPVCVIDAFSIPTIAYDPVAKRLYEDTSNRTMLAPGAAKPQLYQARLQLLQQRLRRNKRFQAPNAVQKSIKQQQQQAHLSDLMGLSGCVGEERLVMGLVSSADMGYLTLEDTTGSVPLDMSAAEVASGLITENVVVVAQGEMGHDGIFRASRVGFPSCETREELPATAKNVNFFGGPDLSTEEVLGLELEAGERPEERLVFLSNVALDQWADTGERLETLFAGFEAYDCVPPMIVFMGNFSSKSCSCTADADYGALRAGFTSLARLLELHPRIREGSRMVFVPGPHDPGLGDLLPAVRLPEWCTEELQRTVPSAVFTTNPCRIRYYHKELVVFRYDLLKAVMRRCLVQPPDLSHDNQDELFCHLAITLLQQSHLCPLPLVVQPVHWQFDQALQLYPLPNAVILADSSAPSSYRHSGCHVFNPGSLQDGVFAAYLPFTDELELSALPTEDDMQGCVHAARPARHGCSEQQPLGAQP